jgi:hypothetical protein
VERVAPSGFANSGAGREGVTPAGFENAVALLSAITGDLSASVGEFTLEGVSDIDIAAALDTSIGEFSLSADGTGPAVEPTAPTFVGAAGRGRARVWVRIENGKVYEVVDEPEARKVVRAIKRKVERQMRQQPAAIVLPVIEVDGVAPFLESLKREVAEVQTDWAAIRRKLEDEDEDDVEALLL